jgi:hypothetical protein
MDFAPDIVVTTPDTLELTLVVQAKVQIDNLERVEADLKRYMVRMHCPLGAIITPEHLWLYRDFYTSRDARSVERIGDYELASVWPRKPPADPGAFEDFVQGWLEGLVDTRSVELPRMLRDVVNEYLEPAVFGADIRAAHPRFS